MNFKQQTFNEHFKELKIRLLKVLFTFIIIFFICYYFSDKIYQILLTPLSPLIQNKKIIYTGLTEAFFSYLKLSAFSSFLITLPYIILQIYAFISPGLYKQERRLAALILFFSPLLFWIGTFFVFYYVMPKAWSFFISFENKDSIIPLILEAKISEYLSLVIQLIIAFGVAFQLPIVILILNIMGIIKVENLLRFRRISIVINFIIAGILTPPDVLSQFALAIPMLLLYEVSIIICKYVENRGLDVRHKMD